MRRRQPRPIAAALEGMSTRLAPATTLARVQAAWDDVAGPTVAAETEPVSEQAGTITIRCASAVWAHELTLLEADLRERLNAVLGGPHAVQELRFSTASRTRVTRGNERRY